MKNKLPAYTMLYVNLSNFNQDDLELISQKYSEEKLMAFLWKEVDRILMNECERLYQNKISGREE